MKSVKKMFKRPVAVAAGTAGVAAAIVSATVLAAKLVDKPSSNPWDYTLYAFRESGTAFQSDAKQFVVDGDIRSGGTASFRGENVSISGNIVAGRSIEQDVAAFSAGNRRENASALTVNPVFSDVYRIGTEGQEITDADEIICNTYQVDRPVVGKGSLQLNISEENPASEVSADQSEYKFGAFGAGFLSSVYENRSEWEPVFPFLFADSDTKSKDLLTAGETGAFLPVGGQAPAGDWKNYDKLPDDPFRNTLSADDIPSYLADRKQGNPVFEICKSDDTVKVFADYSRGASDPAEAWSAKYLTVSGGKFALNGDYTDLEAIRFENSGGAQLLGSYPNLRYIYMPSWGFLNLAGDFPALECVYFQGGQLLLGTGDTGFSASNAAIMMENGSMVLYTAQDVTLDRCELLTLGNIVLRGSGRDAEPSKFSADESLFAAAGAVSFEDMHDNNTEKAANVPVFYSGMPLSVVNSDFEMMQGCFIAQNGAAVLTESRIGTLRGFLFMPYGINASALGSGAQVYVNTFGYNIDPHVRPMGTQPDDTWKKGTIETLEAARFPLAEADRIMDASAFVKSVSGIQDADGNYAEHYRFRGIQRNSGILTLNSSVFAEDDITITAGILEGGYDSLPVIASRTGDITITVDTEIAWNGIIYAPNGTVKISGTGQINGRIFAQKIEIASEQLTVKGGDYDLSAIGFAAPQQKETTAATSAVSATALTTAGTNAATVLSDELTAAETTSDKTTATTAAVTDAAPQYTNAAYEYDQLGRLTKVIFDEKNFITYSYDANGNITEVKKTVDGVTAE